jgi:IS5 family transposase
MGRYKAIKPRVSWLSPVTVDPLRHEPLVAEAFFRNGAPFDPGESLREGHLLRCRQPVHVGYVKTRYRGLAKNRAQLFTLFALGNLFLVRRRLMA